MTITADWFVPLERNSVHYTSKDLIDDLLRTMNAFGFKLLILSGVRPGEQKLALSAELNGKLPGTNRSPFARRNPQMPFVKMPAAAREVTDA